MHKHILLRVIHDPLLRTEGKERQE